MYFVINNGINSNSYVIFTNGILFWNVNSFNRQQPVTMNEQGVVLVSGMSPQIFAMLKDDKLDPYAFMMSVLNSARYEGVAA